ncbi:DnaJ domain-containing protein, partial [Candidatus Bathyarchaeota archaeon]|nr:DnaJ domain-containing protein [Candidatus Bathyarchaeota archaeon]
MTFYDILDIAPAASIDEITKAYRKKTRDLHPDKVRQKLVSQAKKDRVSEPSTKGPTESDIRTAQLAASGRQTRLGLIAEVLRGPERDRYDHFLSNGFPVWK